MKKITAAITGVGGYVPEFALTNQMLETMVDTTDEWITTRTGIKERRILKGEGKGSSFLGIQAAKNLLDKTGTAPEEIDLIIFATATPDMPVASSGVYLATQIGAVNAFAFDLQAACSSFLFGMSVAAKYIESGAYKKVMLVGADKMSSIIDYTDRATCIIFGDGAGAVLFEPSIEGLGLIDEQLYSDGSGRNFLKIDAGGSIMPTTVQTLSEGKNKLIQDGKTVFKHAVSGMAKATGEIMQRNALTGETIDFLVPHQANKRIIDAVAHNMNLPESKVMVNIQKYGNTTSATLPLALLDYENKLKKGDNLIFVTFGGGFTWGAIYLKWAY